MIELDNIYNADCLNGIKQIPDNSVDLLVTDPPYVVGSKHGGGAFGTGEKSKSTQNHYEQIQPISDGFTTAVLDECCRVLKKVNAYVWCSKNQLLDLMQYFKDRKCNIDILTWHKTNPVPACNNKYLSDTEYLVFAREKGVKVYGSFETKRKYWITPLNTKDKNLWQHPTIKPLDIIYTLVYNSSQVGGVVLDPFIGSGTTAVAARNLGRHYIGFEIDQKYYDKAIERLSQPTQMITDWRLP